MKRAKRRAAAFLAASLGLAPSVANAACLQSDLTGNWRLYFLTGPGWFICNFKVAAGGAVSSNKGCKLFDGTKYGIDGGKFKMATPASCLVSGSVKLSLQGMNGGTLKFEEAALAVDHETMTGIGSVGSSFFPYSLTKY